ncbi:hypothetical protein FYZ48_27160 [Gimesia chilikensis]|uniref:hypothetical protein n=1 Tax=Gimesia chilikensis TaxID=2605989 RepID=UPI0011EE647E|nr:hypothetical protein [Gimesia chilikensis]KAA0131811.1 hypothetical protein FYZ48_27160 [Gimesia chilikensis]
MSSIPEPSAYFLNVPLYDSFDISDSIISAEDAMKFLAIECFSGTIDSYCIECGSESIFSASSNNNPYITDFHEGGIEKIEINISRLKPNEYYNFPTINSANPLKAINHVEFPHHFQNIFKCSRDENHLMIFNSISNGKKLQKIGQYPSIADLHLPSLNKYKKILSKDDLSELKRGVGLSAHGVGIGACIYLRRLFEKLINGAFSEALLSGDTIDQEIFFKSRKTEQIDVLKNYLPKLLVENKKMYGILSKAIHDLSESECLRMFPILLNGIELILDEKLTKVEKDKKESETKRLIHQLTGKIDQSSKKTKKN